MKCQTCIHRYVCKYLFIFSEKDFERCIDYRIDESTVSKRKFAKVGKIHHIAEVSKKVKSVYPVKSESLCEKCFYNEQFYGARPCITTKPIYTNLPLGSDMEKHVEITFLVKADQPCKYFIRDEKGVL